MRHADTILKHCSLAREVYNQLCGTFDEISGTWSKWGPALAAFAITEQFGEAFQDKPSGRITRTQKIELTAERGTIYNARVDKLAKRQARIELLGLTSKVSLFDDTIDGMTAQEIWFQYGHDAADTGELLQAS